MKRWIAILLAACLALAGTGAFAQADDAGAESEPASSRLPAPEVVAELEDDGEAQEDAEPAPETTDEAEATDEAEEEDADAPEATEIPEAEPTQTPAAEEEDVEVWFEEGFGLTVPAGWVSYAVSDQDRENGVRYALGDGSGDRNLYIQIRPTRLNDFEALSEAVGDDDDLVKTGELTFGDTDFVAFIDAVQNVSCCATLWKGELAVFMFTPQTDSDFMLIASQLMESFRYM